MSTEAAAGMATIGRGIRGGALADERREDWYTDPYERHEARWMSAGRPTKLVRDGKVESHDAPPDEEPV